MEFCCGHVAYLQTNTDWSHTFAWMFSCKLSKLFVEHLSWNTPLGDYFCYYKGECSINLFRVKIEKLEQGVKYVQSEQ